MRVSVALSAIALALMGHAAAAAEPEPERCPRFVAFNESPIPARFVTAAEASARDVRLTYVGHSTFLIESPAGISIATDYNDYVRPPIVPTVATMNRAHPNHFSFNPDPGIRHVLQGWGEEGVPAHYELTVEDVWIRNVTTNIRGGYGVSGFIQRDMNSIFVFEVAELCIAHLGHLHHPLTAEHLKALGRIDVVLAPVGGGASINTPDLIAMLRQIGAPLVIPMHFVTYGSLPNFLAAAREHYLIEESDTPRIVLSRDTLPSKPTVLVLPGH